ncbi:MAG: MobC family plasmid mobilization relaxosome protein [Desulfobulbia bacterium]
MERDQQRKAIIKVRVTGAEQAGWQTKAEAAGVSVSELVRRAMTRVKTWTHANSEIERERNRELAKIGNNLNQIARWANTYKSAADAIEVVPHLRSIEQMLDSFFSSRPTAGSDAKNSAVSDWSEDDAH